ncbi:winged helix-turn-helix transcriptional regulator [Amycolatopsis eburnea]|uniref:Transcriptional regulator n=1 Tax=Amycolatopsis eburnea TaxID=2267691 RepID=A0A427T677_9PSEU|nr:helix-turn-helix domain-containing protein [Amycolatopsis eburnea]RSD14798.1 transcriptional regulator [Amycolatopsis eburnea]
MTRPTTQAITAEDAERLRKLHDAKQLFGGDWMTAILLALKSGPKHYTELLGMVGSLNDAAAANSWSGRPRVLHASVLTRTLKTMTADRLIVRHQEPGVFPPSVVYTLTSDTREALDAMQPLADWVSRHGDIVEQARHRRTLGARRSA